MSNADVQDIAVDPVARAKDFVARHVAPRELELDARTDPAQCFDWGIITAAHEYGLRTLMLDHRYGGEGIDFRVFMQVTEELAKGDVGVAGSLTQVNRLAATLQDVGTEQQKDSILPQVGSDPYCMLAYCSTEPNLGSDRALPTLSGPSITKYATKATRVDGGWELSGTKIYIDDGSTARYLFVMAQTDEAKPITTGSTAFIVNKENPGVFAERVFDKMGVRLGVHAEVRLDRCHVRDEDVFGAVNGGHRAFASRAGETNAISGARALGVGEAAYACAVDYAKDRVQGGRRLIDHGAVRYELAKHRMALDVARAYVQAAVAAVVGRGPDDQNYDNFTKVVAGQAAFDMAVFAVELHGARGYTRGWRVEKLLRDAASFDHIGTPHRTALLRAARQMYGDAQPIASRPDFSAEGDHSGTSMQLDIDGIP